MKKILRWVVFVPFGAILVLFLVANRQPIALSLDPFSTQAPAFATPSLPLWLWLAFSLFSGFFLGAAYQSATDAEALEMFGLCSKLEGIIPALEPAHALARAIDKAASLGRDKIVLVNLCGRGDKDIFAVMPHFGGAT